MRVTKGIKFVYQLPWEADGTDYVLFPACAYAGNQFRCLAKNYPPVYHPDSFGLDMPITITDVPRLQPDGSGKLQVTTGDVSVPCVGVFSARYQKAVLLFTVQQMNGENLGIAYEQGRISVTSPAERELIYRWPFMHQNESYEETVWEETKDTAKIPCQVLEFSCDSLKEFYRVFFENRKCMGLDDARGWNLPYQEQFIIQCRKFNDNYSETWGYDLDTALDTFGVGWCGGGMIGYPLMKLGGEQEWRRGIRSLEYVFENQGKSGFLHGLTDRNGKHPGDHFGVPGTENWHLVRRSADMLYFCFKYFRLFQERGKAIPDAFAAGARRIADAFVKLYQTYGQIGQFVDAQTGELLVGGSAAGTLVPAALMEAWRFYGNAEYRDVAEKAADFYYDHFLSKGYTTGAPGEILQCPDSESASALLESYVVLYDVTRDRKWLDYAEFAAYLCSSWVVAYNYRFPEESEFGKLGVKTVGTVFANSQNKHSAPGFCTMSGDCLIKLYHFTGNEKYLELIGDVASALCQCMSTEEHPIYSWDVPKDASLLNDDTLRAEPERLIPGRMCERVNMSDWESFRCIGGVFNGSCWCEVSNLLKLAEIPEKILYS